jgi:hypothetical protein
MRRYTFLISFLLGIFSLSAQTIYVSNQGRDTWDGTERQPVATLAKAQELARRFTSETDVDIVLEDGTYYLPETFVLTVEDSKTYSSKVTYRARNEGKVIISGGWKLDLIWKKGEKGIWTALIDEDVYIDQLYVNGERKRMARYPNAIPGEGRNVYDTWVLNHSVEESEQEDALAQSRIDRWSNPEGGYVHAMHHALWGDMHWLIKGKASDGTLDMEGGWQNNRPSSMHEVYRMVENIREELDVPGEWFYDKQARRLYYYPESDEDMNQASIEVVRLGNLIEVQGERTNPVVGLRFQGLVFRHSNRTFMENKEQLLRSDWTIYRGGALFFNGAEDCVVENCEFDQLGGNSVFVNNYNKRILIKGCYIHQGGANGIAFVGNPQAVRSPIFRYGPQDYEHIDRRVGPLSDDYPQECRVEDCLITLTGRDEKQTSPIQISMSYRITVSHCSIYDVPRAGINISEGTFGGHVIEHCDVFNTVLETGDHGSFNSWGRDRFWTPKVATFSKIVSQTPEMTAWDMIEPNVIRNNRWRCDHGWDVDLDDGSSHYRIYNNLMLNGGLKLREGYDRVVTNNIILNNSLHMHDWPTQSRDVFKHNIVLTAYQPALMEGTSAVDGKWGKELDYNFFATDEESMRKYADYGTDAHSITGDPMFVNASEADFRIKEESPVWNISFHNFDMHSFGVLSKRLKAIAKTPEIPALKMSVAVHEESKEVEWNGAILYPVSGNAMSAFGVSLSETALAVKSVAPGSKAERIGLQVKDLLWEVNGVRIKQVSQLEKCSSGDDIMVVRSQQTLHLKNE